MLNSSSEIQKKNEKINFHKTTKKKQDLQVLQEKSEAVKYFVQYYCKSLIQTHNKLIKTDCPILFHVVFTLIINFEN